MADFYESIISLLDRIRGSYPAGIATAALQQNTASPSQEHQDVSCVMVICGESNERRETAVDFARDVCRKGLALSHHEYRIICEDTVIDGFDSYSEQLGAQVVVFFQGDAGSVSTKNASECTYIVAPSASQVVDSPSLKRMLWSALKCFRRTS